MAPLLSLLTCLFVVSFSNCEYEDLALCGLHRTSDVSSRIFNGSSVYLGEYPWVVHMRFGSTYCTGGILKPRWILTAAHCLHSAVLNPPIIITYGRLNPANMGSGGALVVSPVENVNVFWYPEAAIGIHDVGLVYINQAREIPLPRTYADIKAINAMCILPPNGFSYPPGGPVVIAGFGNKGVPTDIPDLLTQTTQTILEAQFCQGTETQVHNGFCYYDPSPTAAQGCGGDSGAPVNAYYSATVGASAAGLSHLQAFSVGIHVTGTIDCGYPEPEVLARGEYHGGYAMRVDRYIDWIEDVIVRHTPPAACVGQCTIT